MLLIILRTLDRKETSYEMWENVINPTTKIYNILLRQFTYEKNSIISSNPEINIFLDLQTELERLSFFCYH